MSLGLVVIEARMVKEDAETRPICRDYVRNTCSRGDSCKYRHPQQKCVFCHDYQNGKCSRVGCAFVHCSRDDEEYYNQYGVLPPHLAELPNTNLYNSDHSDVPICKDFLKGECLRNICKFRHLVLKTKHDDCESHMRKRMRYEIEEPYIRALDIAERSCLWTVEDENIILRKTVAELRKRVDDLQATNEFLLEQNAQMRINDKASGLTAVTVPAVTINATPLPQQVNGAIRTVATVPVSIATVAGTPVSIAAVSMAPVQIPSPVVSMATQHPEQRSSTQIIASQTSLVSYPIVARPVLPPMAH